MQVPGSDNAGPGGDILGPELLSEGIETLLEKKKATGIMLRPNFILSEIFISEWFLSLRILRHPSGEDEIYRLDLSLNLVLCNMGELKYKENNVWHQFLRH